MNFFVKFFINILMKGIIYIHIIRFTYKNGSILWQIVPADNVFFYFSQMVWKAILATGQMFMSIVKQLDCSFS